MDVSLYMVENSGVEGSAFFDCSNLFWSFEKRTFRNNMPSGSK